VLRVGKGSYAFTATAPCWIDTEAFQRSYEMGRRDAEGERWSLAVRAYRQALSLYRGDYLVEDLYAEWADPFREHWRNLKFDILEGLSNCHLRLGQYRAAAECCQQVIAAEPYLERAYRQKMRCHHVAGDYGLALQTFAACREALKELGVEPSPETVAAYREVHEGRPRPAVVNAPERQPVPLVCTSLPHPPALPLLGRDDELAGLEQDLARASGNLGRVVLLAGPAGIGKTRLVEAVLGHVGRPELSPTRWRVALASRCHGFSRNFPCAPLVELLGGLLTAENQELLAVPDTQLAEIRHLLQRLADLQSPPPEPSDDSLRSYYPLFQGVAAVLAALSRPALMVIEDLHLADPWTRLLLGYLAYHRSTRGMAILLTLRSGEAPQELLRELHVWHREGLVNRHDLQPLSRETVRQLTATVLGTAGPKFSDRLWAATLGNPYYVVEFLHSLQRAGGVREGGAAAMTRLPLPATVQAMVSSRVERLPSEVGELLKAAAIFPHATPFRALEMAAGLGRAQAVSALEVLLRGGYLEEGQGGKVRLCDPVVRRAVLHELSEAHRDELDGRLACAGRGSPGEACDECLRLASGLPCTARKIPNAPGKWTNGSARRLNP
jgi:tetratricopeptide (TPR) repeat protein